MRQTPDDELLDIFVHTLPYLENGGLIRERLDERKKTCLLYTSDAADERSSVDLGGRRIIKKKKNKTQHTTQSAINQNNKKKWTKNNRKKQ